MRHIVMNICADNVSHDCNWTLGEYVVIVTTESEVRTGIAASII